MSETVDQADLLDAFLPFSASLSGLTGQQRQPGTKSLQQLEFFNIRLHDTMKFQFQNLVPVTMLALANMFLVSTSQADVIWGVTSSNTLISWHASSPQMLNSGIAITGLQTNEQLVGIDTRPLTGELFAIGSSSRVYIIDPMTGMANQLGSQFSQTLSGSQFAYDFNPTIDRSRLVSDTRANYVVNPINGSIGRFTDVFYANGDPNFGMAPNIVHAAYDNNVAGAMTSQLYSIDSGLNILARQANSAGTLNTVGSLGIDINGIGGFDVSGSSGMAYAALMLEGSSRSGFYGINLMTGEATFLGQIGAGNVITAMSVSAIPEPSTGLLSLIGLGALACLLYTSPSPRDRG
jgi:hypothetical protein